MATTNNLLFRSTRLMQGGSVAYFFFISLSVWCCVFKFVCLFNRSAQSVYTLRDFFEIVSVVKLLFLWTVVYKFCQIIDDATATTIKNQRECHLFETSKNTYICYEFHSSKKNKKPPLLSLLFQSERKLLFDRPFRAKKKKNLINSTPVTVNSLNSSLISFPFLQNDKS